MNDWVGILHDPPNTFNYYPRKNITKHTNFVRSLPKCKGLFCMSHELVQWIQTELHPPFFVEHLYHPLPMKSMPSWDPDLFTSKYKIVQIGNWLRNPYSIFKLKVPNKYLLPYDSRYKDELDYFVRRDRVRLDPREFASVTKLSKRSDEEYGKLFEKNVVVFLHLYSSTCNNVVLECIQSHTPILINRLPAIEAYLGKDYPMLYTSLPNATTLLTHYTIIRAHTYLKALDTSRFKLDQFVHTIQTILNERREQVTPKENKLSDNSKV